MIRLLFIVSLVMCQGCANKSNLLQKKSDTLTKSSCEACEKKPFYKNGKWI
jgi:hypothetical protein